MGFFQSFMGNDQRRDIQKANKKATKYINTGYDDTMGFKNQAYGLYDPVTQQGRAAYDLYTNALGLNGGDKAQSASDTIYNNPLFRDMNNYTQRENQALFNSRGDSAGGNAQWAAQDVTQKNLMNYLAMIRGVGDRGDQATNAQANIRLGQGDLAWGRAGTLAGQEINKGNALAAARSIGPQNMINLAGTVVSAATGMPRLGGSQPVYSEAGTAANGGWSTTANQSSNNLMSYFNPRNWG